MRGFFRSNTFKILLIVLLSLSAVYTLSFTTGDTSFGSLFGFVSTPMQETGAALTADLREKFAGMTRQELEDYCAGLSAENGTLRGQLVDYYTLSQQNDQLQKALDYKKNNPKLDLAPASVIARDPSDLFYGFSIDAGYLDGISKGDPVITQQGVVGSITEVYATSARVTTILSETVQIGAIAKEHMENGVVTGGVEDAASGNVRLRYLTKESKIQKGTLITTSGAGGVFPQDLIIGKVAFLGSAQEDVSLYAIVEPFEDLRRISDVFVITNFPGKDELPLESGEVEPQVSP